MILSWKFKSYFQDWVYEEVVDTRCLTFPRIIFILHLQSKKPTENSEPLNNMQLAIDSPISEKKSNLNPYLYLYASYKISTLVLQDNKHR